MLIAAQNINSHNFLHFPSYPSPSVIWSSKQTKFNSFCDMKLWKPQLACRRQTNAILWTCRSIHMDAYTINKYDFSTGEKMNKETSNSAKQTNRMKFNAYSMLWNHNWILWLLWLFSHIYQMCTWKSVSKSKERANYKIIVQFYSSIQ